MTGYGKDADQSKTGGLLNERYGRGDRGVSRCARREEIVLIGEARGVQRHRCSSPLFHPGEDLLEIRPGFLMIGRGLQDVLILSNGFPVFAGLSQAIG